MDNNHAELDEAVNSIILADMAEQQLKWDKNKHKLILKERAAAKVRARNGYTIGQLVHLSRENLHTNIAPEDITGIPFRASNSRIDCDLSSGLPNGLRLPFPVFSSNMECVTGAKLATTIAQLGGVGVTHQFQSADEQAADIKAVKAKSDERVEIDGREFEPALNKDGELIVGAATSISGCMERASALIDAGADIIVLDTAHGHSQRMADAIKKLKERFPETVLLAGNVITAKGAYELFEAGADGVKAGVGPGWSCSTRRVTGFGVPMISGLYSVAVVARYFRQHGREVFVIGDGGISDSGDAVKYFAAGVDGIMLGTRLAQTSDSPACEQSFCQEKNDVLVWGSASDRAKNRQARPRWDAPEGLDRRIPYLGETSLYLARLMTGVQSGLSYSGTNDYGVCNLARHAKHSRWALQSPFGFFEGAKTMF
ncbi:guanosine monophosphate reductase [Candidatus Woesearchaeota archaeon]|nr:guanosine monophosphate reductase [Candidatus Woesearchaeota archaeon]